MSLSKLAFFAESTLKSRKEECFERTVSLLLKDTSSDRVIFWAAESGKSVAAPVVVAGGKKKLQSPPALNELTSKTAGIYLTKEKDFLNLLNDDLISGYIVPVGKMGHILCGSRLKNFYTKAKIEYIEAAIRIVTAYLEVV